MGVGSNIIPPLPAPTETDENETPSELTATEFSKPGDERSCYSLPDDGSPVTIRTRGHKANRSQTSLLIEYFEGSTSGKSSERKPSVRVRLTPSKKGKGDHLQLTESSRGSDHASHTHRIPLDYGATSQEIDLPEGDDGHSMTSYASQTEESNVSRNPIDIEIDRSQRRRRPASPLIPSTTDSHLAPVDGSEVSAIPADSFLDGSGPSTDYKRSSSPARPESLAPSAIGGTVSEISTTKSRGGRERVKISDKARERSTTSERKRRPKSRATSVSENTTEEPPRRRASRSRQESAVSGPDSSVISSNVTQSHRSYGAHSARSDVSRSSINNPKLLETVEDAIRRLILPELSALKREQSKRESRRGSITSTGTSGSREDLATDRRRSSGRSDLSKDGSRIRERRNREARHDYDANSQNSASRESFHDDYEDPDATTTPKRSHDMLKAAATGAAAAKGISAYDDMSHTEDRKQRDRRRRRADGARSKSLGRDRYSEQYDDEPAPAPPMPLMSEINPSEMTRTSILSADSRDLDRPHSASEEMAPSREVPRATPDTPADPARGLAPLGMTHANVSQGDLKALPRGNKNESNQEYEVDDFGRKIPIEYHEYDDDSDPGDFADDAYNNYYSTQDVPPPLKYVPYQAGARGLSPIPSVSGYTESEIQPSRHSFSAVSGVTDPDRSFDQSRHSMQSPGSVPSNMRSREFDRMSIDDDSVRSAADRRDTMYTEDSEMSQRQAMRGVGANPNVVHPSMGVESAVASLVDGSMLDPSILSGDYNAPRESMLSYDSRGRGSRGTSPEKRAVADQRDLQNERHPTPGDRSQDFSEYEVDDYGRKIPRTKYRHSPTASEAAITAGAVGAAAAALKAAQEKRQADGGDEWVGGGVDRNKSFKERTMEGYEPRNTPAHSVDRFSIDEPKMGASGLPDMGSPMPEIGYVDDDVHTNPSIQGEERFDVIQTESGRATPTQGSMIDYGQVIEQPEIEDEERGLGITEAAGAAALGAAVGMAAAHEHEGEDQDEWQRSSEDRKRDTLLTNPYEDTSPINNPALNENLLGSRGMNYGPGFHTGSPGLGQKYDEGYMSNDPTRTPDIQGKGKGVDFTGATKRGDEEDPFYNAKPNNPRQMSGMSQGMGSPFYDAATGAGIDRIENQDIVALMQHLMVRDAQRSARDTEIVALLMNAALEMRNSFREMKDLIQDTGDDMIFANAENTEKLQKAINGPRPFPGAAARSIQSSQPPTVDSAAQKKKNLWKRALAGLSTKGTSDLGRIEDMLMQLLGEVDVLKTQTAPEGQDPRQSMDDMQSEGQYEQDRGYEPEGVSTASHASQSGHLSIPPSRGQGSRHTTASDRRYDHRVSTVPENDDEYLYDHPSPSRDRSIADVMNSSQTPRGGSVPPESPSQRVSFSPEHAQSADNTPRTEKGKKHKSGSSTGWLPKISRWSETTASSVGRAFKGGKKEQKYDDAPVPSRSGSSLDSYDDDECRHDPYGEDKLHSGFSEPNLPGSSSQQEPINPAQAAIAAQEDPKYRAHRNSLNLQHPQPRPGGGERFRTALEFSAQEYDQPVTPRSAEWAGSSTSLNRLPPNANRYGNVSPTPAREPDYWPTSPTNASGPPRPPKEPLDGTKTPTRSRISKLAQSSPLQNQVYDNGYTSPTPGSPGSVGSRAENRSLNAAMNSDMPSRRPSGPRAMTPKSPEEEAAREERRRKRGLF